MDRVDHPRAARRLTLRERQKAETRGRVIAAARAQFVEKGFEAATIRDIAKEAGVAPGSVFTTFDSKTELLLAILEARYAETAEAALLAAGRHPHGLAQIEAIGRAAYVADVSEAKLLMEALALAFRWDGPAERDNRRRFAGFITLFVDAVRDAAAAGEFDPQADLALVVELIVTAYFANLRRALSEGASAQALGDRFARQIRLIRDGCRAEAPPARAARRA